MPLFVGRFGGCCTSSFFSHRIHRRCLRPGDHLYVWSSIAHHHHAVYVGAGRDVGYKPSVIHVYGANKFASEVRVDTVNDFLRGRLLRRARYGVPWWHLYVKPAGTCYSFGADAPEEIVARAWRWLESDQRGRAAANADADRTTNHPSGGEPETPAARAARRVLTNAELDAAAEVDTAIARWTASIPAGPSPEPDGKILDDADSADIVAAGDLHKRRVLQRMLRSGSLAADAAEGKLVTVADSPWVYNLFRRNCEHFTLLCTAPGKQSGSHQSQQLTRFNPLATLVLGLLERLNYYRHVSGLDDLLTRVFTNGRAAEHRKAAKRYAARTQFRGRMLRRFARWRMAGSKQRLRARMAALDARIRDQARASHRRAKLGVNAAPSADR